MTSKEFNDKYKQYIPQGWGGLEFDIPEVTEYLDKVMQDMILIPEFQIHQIKLKFNRARFYFDTAWKHKELEGAIMVKIEERIDQLVMQSTKPSRMDIIGQNGNEGTHYDTMYD